MATVTSTTKVDDLDGTGSENVGTVHFSLGVTDYSIDLSDENFQVLLETLVPYIEAARVVTSDRTQKKRKAPSAKTGEGTRIRAWAKEQGIPVGDRGRLPYEVVSSYYAGHSAATHPPMTHTMTSLSSLLP